MVDITIRIRKTHKDHLCLGVHRGTDVEATVEVYYNKRHRQWMVVSVKGHGIMTSTILRTVLEDIENNPRYLEAVELLSGANSLSIMERKEK